MSATVAVKPYSERVLRHQRRKPGAPPLPFLPLSNIVQPYTPVRFLAATPPGAFKRAYRTILRNLKSVPHPGLSDEQATLYHKKIQRAMATSAFNSSLQTGSGYFDQKKDEARKYRSLLDEAWASVSSDIISSDDLAAVQWVKKLGIPVRWTHSYELLKAIKKRSMKLIRYYVEEEGSDVNMHGAPLIEALITCNYDIIALVLDLGAKYDSQIHNGPSLPLSVLYRSAKRLKIQLEDRTVQLVATRAQEPRPDCTAWLRCFDEKTMRLVLTCWGIVSEAQDNYMLARGLPEPKQTPYYQLQERNLTQAYVDGFIGPDEFEGDLKRLMLEYYRSMPRPSQSYLNFYRRLVEENEDQWPHVQYKQDPSEQEREWEHAKKFRWENDVSDMYDNSD